MTAESDFYLDWIDSDSDPLVSRLRALRSTEAPAEVRERCWQQLQARIAEMHGEPEPERPLPEELRDYDRLTFTVRVEPRRTTLAERCSRPRALSALALH
jgi:hypothetical protein